MFTWCFHKLKFLLTYNDKNLTVIIAGTPNYPDLETYCKKVGLETYDTFLILSADRFTENDLQLAKRVRAMEKSFFFVRTKIDQDVWNEKKRKGIEEDVTLSVIRKDCLENLTDWGSDDKDVFLICTDEPAKWDFARLAGAMLDSLPTRLKESLTLTLGLLTTESKDILKRKADVLRGNLTVQLVIDIYSEKNALVSANLIK